MGSTSKRFFLQPNSPLACYTSHDGISQIWDAFSGTILHTFPDSTLVRWSPDGRYLAASGISAGADPSPIHIWNVQTGQLLQSYTGNTSQVFDIQWLDTGDEILSSDIANIMLWNAMTGKTLLKIRQTTSNNTITPTVPQRSPNGRFLARPTDAYVQLTDLRTAKPMRTLLCDSSSSDGRCINFLATAWSPDSLHMTTIDVNGRLQIWNVQSGQLELTYKLPMGNPLNNRPININDPFLTPMPFINLAWSPDGKMLAVTTLGNGLIVLGMSGHF